MWSYMVTCLSRAPFQTGFVWLSRTDPGHNLHKFFPLPLMLHCAFKQSSLSLNQKAARQLRRVPGLAARAVALTLAANAQGAVNTWVGNTLVNWNATNWTGGNPIPLDFDSLVFGAAGTAGAVLNNDLAAETLISGITFNAGASAYTFNGNAISLGGPVLKIAPVWQTINLPLNWAADFHHLSGRRKYHPRRRHQRQCRR